MTGRWTLHPDRCFATDPARLSRARTLYAGVRDAPIVSPHGHVDPVLLADPAATFGTPADLLIIPDHYIFRLLYSRGIAMQKLGVPTIDGSAVETDHRRIWQRFAEHFHLFAGTPSGFWLSDELTGVFGVSEKLNGSNAQTAYDHIVGLLATPDFTPRALYKRFNIQTLCTTDAATSDLAPHLALHEHDQRFDVRPTFRPDAVVNLDTPGWREHVERLGQLAGADVSDYRSYIDALWSRRAAFKALGATATDHAALTPYTERLSDREAGTCFDRALLGAQQPEDAARFTAHMLMEMARMSAEDGLVMQLHAGSYRNHNADVFARFGPDKGADIPVATEWTRSLRALLNEHGNDSRFRLILFTLDETTFSRELAPLAGHYPAVLLGPPWWFLDSANGMRRFLDDVVETAGLYNLAGFNDDTRAFCSIPARHDLWRRVSCDWLAGQVTSGMIDMEDAADLAMQFAFGLARRAYNLS